MQVLIATPTAGQRVKTAYTSTLISATRAIHALRMDYNHATFDGADIVMGRNYLANKALSRPEVQWVLWLGNDMVVPEPVFRRLFTAQKTFIGALYPEPTLDLDRYARYRNDGMDEAQARALVSRFDIRVPAGALTIDQGLTTVLGMGLGCVLTHRSVLERLASTGIAPTVSARHLAKYGLADTMFDFFSQLPDPQLGRLSPDHSFCARATQLGETLWALADVELRHAGGFEYGASFLANLQAKEQLR